MLKAGVDTDFLNTGTHGAHWFPIIRLQTLLDAAQLKSCNTARVLRKSSKIATGDPSQISGLSTPYNIQVLVYHVKWQSEAADMVRSQADIPRTFWRERTR
jgi:hypothetical protein